MDPQRFTSAAVPSQGTPPPVPPAPPMPRVVTWYRVYAAAFVVLYSLVAVMGVALMIWGEDIDMRDGEGLATGAICVALGVPFAIASLVGALAPPRKWSWIYGLCLIALGMTSACCMPASVPLLIFWLKDETKAHFEMK